MSGTYPYLSMTKLIDLRWNSIINIVRYFFSLQIIEIHGHMDRVSAITFSVKFLRCIALDSATLYAPGQYCFTSSTRKIIWKDHSLTYLIPDMKIQLGKNKYNNQLNKMAAKLI